MAQSDKVLLELVECAICLGVLKNPYQLNCLHTFCHDCLQKLPQDSHKISCPKCREQCHMNSLKKDFKTQEIVNLYNAQIKEEVHNEFLNRLVHGRKKCMCQVCEKVNKVGELKCIECDQVMCGQCDKIHQSIKSCKNHTVVPNDEILTLLKEKVGADRWQLQVQRKEQVQTLKHELNHKIEDLATWRKSTASLLDEAEQRHVRSIQDHYASLKLALTEVDSEFVKRFKEQKEQIEKYNHDACAVEEAWMQRVNTAMVDQQLLEIAEVGVEDFRSQVDQLGQSLCKFHQKVTVPPLSVIPGGEIDLTETTRIVAQFAAFKPFVDDSVSKMIQNKYQGTTSVKLDYMPQRLRKIENNIFCSGSDNSISVFDLNCQPCGKIVEPNLRYLRSLTEVCNGCLVAACDNGVGLHILDRQPKYVGAIATGSFCDVTSWSFNLYGLEYEQCSLMTFQERGHHKWSKVHEFKLAYTNRHSNSWDTVCVNKDGIFICGLKTCSVYQHDHNGQLLQQFGEKGSGELGRLRHPRLSFVDSQSSVLILDTQNDRLQVFNCYSGRWSQVYISGEFLVPLDATVDHSAATIWVIQDSCGTPYLTKCVLKKPPSYT